MEHGQWHLQVNRIYNPALYVSAAAGHTSVLICSMTCTLISEPTPEQAQGEDPRILQQ